MKFVKFISLRILQTKNKIIYFLYKFFFLLIGFFYINNFSKKIKKTKKKTKKIIIFGSDRSINLISKKEKKIISKYKIIFMNKNLIFWKHINIWPDYYFLSDTPIKSNKAYRIFIDTIHVICKKKNSPALLLENIYKSCFFSKENIYFKTNYQSNNLKWAKNKNDTLFGFHGSLTTLLNLISLNKIGSEVLLVGFDMRNKNYFFDKDTNFSKYADASYFQKSKLHPNAIRINKKNIFSHWKIININLKLNDINLFCNNKKSLLCQKKLVKFKSISKFCKK